jgi:toxin ParE1/3/4
MMQAIGRSRHQAGSQSLPAPKSRRHRAPSREVGLTRSTTKDRKAIREYIAADNLAAALAFDEMLSENVTRRLIDHPGIGRPGRVVGTRELVAHQNYTAADLVHVLHTARWRHNGFPKQE